MFSADLGVTPSSANYIEDVFSTYLYTGNGSTQTITNGIDLSGKGGLVWIKKRDSNIANTGHILEDTARGANYYISTNSTNAESYEPQNFTFNSDGFGMNVNNLTMNYASSTYASWTFRKQAKFFDVVTYTGNGVSNRTVSHSLGSVPGCIFFKITSTTGDWVVLHQNNGTTPRYGYLNLTSAMPLLTGSSMSTFASSATFSPGALDSALNLNGATYVAYLFAHDAGGFGATGSDNVISCGSFTTNASGVATVTLGYEPQWVLIKRTDGLSEWTMLDNMRGFSLTTDAWLRANSSAAESTAYTIATPTATGFVTDSTNIIDPSSTFIYIAIRRGPMKTPTTGTSVFFPQAYSDSSLGTSNPTNLGASAGFPVDMFMHSMRQVSTFCSNIFDRLRGSNPALITSGTDAEDTGEPLNAYNNAFDIMSGVKSAYNNRFYYYTALGRNHIAWNFRRAPGFFDVVCDTGTGASKAVTHNLGVAPELIIRKWRTGATGENWVVLCTAASSSPDRRLLYLDLTAAGSGMNSFFSDSGGTPVLPTATQFTVGTNEAVNKSAATYVSYLFATVAGVSKVGSYTGTGTTKQIDCGFTGGARFVLIKRTDSTGDWYVWDSARGIVAGNDPYLLLNSTAAEVTSTDYVDAYSAGFEISSTAPAAINANGGTFIFWAVA